MGALARSGSGPAWFAERVRRRLRTRHKLSLVWRLKQANDGGAGDEPRPGPTGEAASSSPGLTSSLTPGLTPGLINTRAGGQTDWRRERLVVTYRLAALPARERRERAVAIAREQTVEIPEGIVSARREAPAVGRVVGRPEALADGTWEVRIAYPLAALCAAPRRGSARPVLDLPQLLNVVYGNVSMWQGVAVAHLGWPPSLLAAFPGPALGIAGLRALCGVPRRPLLCAALKPLGLSVRELARLAGRAAEAGVDLVKDDHGLADQVFAPLRERLRRCQGVVREAAVRAGSRTLYVPNLSGPVERLEERLELARELGIRVVMLAPALLGLDHVRAVVTGAARGIAVLGHPSFSGAWLAPGHGLTAETVWGELFRLIGCDGVIYPNAGGRFPITAATVAAVHQRLRAPLGATGGGRSSEPASACPAEAAGTPSDQAEGEVAGAVRPALPLLGGGIQPATVAGWVERFGPDTGFLVGGAIYRSADPVGTARGILDALARWE